jgi:hypothetical protein
MNLLQSNFPKHDLHLFVVWEKSREFLDEIRNDILKHLVIHSSCEVEWSEKNKRENYARFYNRPIQERGTIDEKKGGGRFIVLIASDPKPDYGLTRDDEFSDDDVASNVFFQNKNVLKVKRLIRIYTSKYGVHSSTNPEEFRHQLVLLFGPSVASKVMNSPDSQLGMLETPFGDCAGAEGWESLEELFWALNLCTDYAVVRKLETFIDEPVEKLKDADLVVKNATTIYNIVGATSRDHHPAAAKFDVLIGGESLFLHCQQVGNGYFDPQWQRCILNNTQGDRVRVPIPEFNFFGEIYQKLVYKKEWTESSRTRILVLGQILGYSTKTINKIISDYKFSVSLLAQWMCSQGFVPTTVQEKQRKHISWKTIRDLERHYPRHLDIIRYKRSLGWTARRMKRRITDEPTTETRNTKKIVYQLLRFLRLI